MDTEKQPHPSAFVRWLEEQACLPGLEDGMDEMVRTVAEIGKAGELTLKIKFKPDGEGKIVVTADFTNKLPKASGDPKTFFITEGCKLTRNNPKQRVMQLPKAEKASG